MISLLHSELKACIHGWYGTRMSLMIPKPNSFYISMLQTLLQCKNTIRIEFVSTKGWKRHDTAWLLLLPYQKGGKSPPMGKIATSTENKKFLSLTQSKLWVMTLYRYVDLWIFWGGNGPNQEKRVIATRLCSNSRKDNVGTFRVLSFSFAEVCVGGLFQ